MLHHTVRTLDLTKETQASPLATRRRARQWRERNDGVEARRKPRQTRGPPADAAQRSHDRLAGHARSGRLGRLHREDEIPEAHPGRSRLSGG